MPRFSFALLLLSLIGHFSFAKTLHVGKGRGYANINTAAKAAVAGDTILVHNGTYPGNQTIDNLQGTRNKWIYILGEEKSAVSINGGSAALMGNDVAYLHIEGFTFSQQTDNGVNISDGASYASPSHHIIFKDCIFRDIATTGNNDQLKLSGVDEFTIFQCTFINGSPGGSGIDMVGCHKGLISKCLFEKSGSNAAQMKGGSSEIRIEGCLFKNAGERAINLGGSTGLPFFRPMDAKWEASDLKVYGNVFIGSDVPVAFVGCTRVEVVNNTIYKPTHWVLRILQENRDTVRFGKCSNNIFRNNVIFMDDKVRVVCNAGPGTVPTSFTFSNNAWYRTGIALNSVQLPAAEKNAIIGKDPLFSNPATEDFTIDAASPLSGAGMQVTQPQRDHNGKPFKIKRSIGAFEVK
ncbi:MAG: right-handed parallel beta-helix repeat-containing protein [Bacteroidota bacterium]